MANLLLFIHFRNKTLKKAVNDDEAYSCQTFCHLIIHRLLYS